MNVADVFVIIAILLTDSGKVNEKVEIEWREREMEETMLEQEKKSN